MQICGVEEMFIAMPDPLTVARVATIGLTRHWRRDPEGPDGDAGAHSLHWLCLQGDSGSGRERLGGPLPLHSVPGGSPGVCQIKGADRCCLKPDKTCACPTGLSARPRPVCGRRRCGAGATPPCKTRLMLCQGITATVAHKKRPGIEPGPVQQGGACDNPHMQRDLMHPC
jgi:hypothetical protein